MSTKFVMHDRVRKIDHKAARRWLGGAGNDAKFEDGSAGYWAVFESCPASIFLGTSVPTLREGDRVRLTLEKV